MKSRRGTIIIRSLGVSDPTNHSGADPKRHHFLCLNIFQGAKNGYTDISGSAEINNK